VRSWSMCCRKVAYSAKTRVVKSHPIRMRPEISESREDVAEHHVQNLTAMYY